VGVKGLIRDYAVVCRRNSLQKQYGRQDGNAERSIATAIEISFPRDKLAGRRITSNLNKVTDRRQLASAFISIDASSISRARARARGNYMTLCHNVCIIYECVHKTRNGRRTHAYSPMREYVYCPLHVTAHCAIINNRSHWFHPLININAHASLSTAIQDPH
jgi:hypothetical protein